MSNSLTGTPGRVSEQLLARYLPLRDSRAHAEPEKHQRKLLRNTAFLLMAAGPAVEVLMVAIDQISVLGVLFGIGLAALGYQFLKASRKPLEFQPPEPLENLPPLAQALGLCRALSKPFPHMPIELDPMTCTVSGSCDGYNWKVEVDREGLKPLSRDEVGYDNSYEVLPESGNAAAARRIWRRTSQLVNKHRIVWTVTIDGEFTPRPGLPSEHTTHEERRTELDKTLMVFTLPVNNPTEPGLGHEGRSDYISSPLGLHHPEFVGEQIAQSLIWMFKPGYRPG